MGDGHTYYVLHHMLAPEQSVVRLRREPVDIKSAVEEAMSKLRGDVIRQFGAAFGRSFGVGKAKNNAQADQYPAPLFFEVNHAALEAAKEECKGEAVAFVSSNDVITATFLSAVAADLGVMAINLRPRLEGLGDDSAGNHENGVFFLGEEFTPPRIRQRLSGHQQPFEHLVPPERLEEGHTALVTSWRFASGIVDFPGCEMALHLPIGGVTIADWRDVGIVFTPREGVTGLMMQGLGVSRDAEAVRQSALGRILGPELLP